MKRNLKVLLCQNDIVWENAEATLSRLECAVNTVCSGSGKPDLLIFPEFFSVGFTMKPEVVEPCMGRSAVWLRDIAVKYRVAAIGSVPTVLTENGDQVRHNRCYFFAPDGSCSFYDKKHLFSISREGQTFEPGSERCTVNYKGWNIELNICYDLRFPAWSRNHGNRYDLLVNVASWPDDRISAADTLIRARAIENNAYAVFSNRVGKDILCNYNGCSKVVDYAGKVISRRRVVDGVEFFSAVLKMDNLLHYREKFPSWKDIDEFTI